MKCPYCGSEHNNIADSRMTEENRRKRRYKCYNCGKSFITYEWPENYFTERFQELLKTEQEYKRFLEQLKWISEERCGRPR